MAQNGGRWTGFLSGRTPSDPAESEKRFPNLMHSRGYHRYFRGYSETKFQNESGRETIRRVYTADWFMLDDSDRNWVKRKILYAALFLLGAAAFILGLVQDSPGNRAAVVAVPGLLSALSLLLTLAALALYLTAHRKMTVHEYESGAKNLRLAAFFDFLLTALTAIAKLLFPLMDPNGDFSLELRDLPFICLSAILFFLLYRMERSARYVNIPNPAREN